MEYRLLNIDDIIIHENSIKMYIDDVLNQSFQRELKQIEIEEKYENMKKFINDNTAIIIGAFEHDRLIGFSWAYKCISNDQERLHISYIVIDKKYRGQGIGTRIFDLLKNIAINKGITGFELIVSSSNKDSINFYKNNNFVEERLLLFKPL